MDNEARRMARDENKVFVVGTTVMLIIFWLAHLVGESQRKGDYRIPRVTTGIILSKENLPGGFSLLMTSPFFIFILDKEWWQVTVSIRDKAHGGSKIKRLEVSRNDFESFAIRDSVKVYYFEVVWNGVLNWENLIVKKR